MTFRYFVLAACLAALPGAAWSGEIADAAAKAETFLSEGKYLDALETLSGASDKAWKQSPLLFRKTLFVASEPEGFGIYEPRPSDVFKASEPLLLYAEPVGFGFGKDGDILVIDMSLDFEIRDKEGKILGGQRGFSTAKLRSRTTTREFYLKLTYTLNGAPAGDYEVQTTVNDKITGKSGTFTMPFTLAP